MQDGKVKTLQELNDAMSAIGSVLNPPGAVISEVDKEQKIWRAYLSVEKNVAILKFGLGLEKPGEFVMDEPKSRELAKYLADAFSALSAGIKLMEDGDAVHAWGELRSARNDLRFYLREIRRLRLRTARTRKPAKA